MNTAKKLLRKMNQTVSTQKELNNFIRCAIALRDICNSTSKSHHSISIKIKDKGGKTIIDEPMMEKVIKGEEVSFLASKGSKVTVQLDSESIPVDQVVDLNTVTD